MAQTAQLMGLQKGLEKLENLENLGRMERMESLARVGTGHSMIFQIGFMILIRLSRGQER